MNRFIEIGRKPKIFIEKLAYVEELKWVCISCDGGGRVFSGRGRNAQDAYQNWERNASPHQRMMDHITKSISEHQPTFFENIRVARKAIAKALGE